VGRRRDNEEAAGQSGGRGGGVLGARMKKSGGRRSLVGGDGLEVRMLPVSRRHIGPPKKRSIAQKPIMNMD
jgi:hypothetical protein